MERGKKRSVKFTIAGLAVMVLLLLTANGARAADAVNEVRLYAINCGWVHLTDMGMFSDTLEYNGKSGESSMPCFLIRHPKGTLLWDTGPGDKFAANKEGVDIPGGHLRVEEPLVDSLKKLGMTPADITYVAFSHLHFDHTGNANAFTSSTWILDNADLQWALSTPTPGFVDPSTFTAYKTVKTQMISGDYDIFGDGSAVMLKAPGHTPGHHVLMLKLKNSGTVILSGDLYHLKANREHSRVPPFNTNRADTLASMNRIETIVKNTNARFIIQHEPTDFKSLPKFPAYLD